MIQVTMARRPFMPLDTPAIGLFQHPGDLSLATDLYELTMAAAYFEHGMAPQTATFELFIRHLPPGRGYLVVAGLEQAIQYLTQLRFDDAALDYLRSQPVFERMRDDFWGYLRQFRFTGDLNAMPEGTIAFANEPLLRVRAPLIEAQMVETALLAIVNHQTLIATKAARVVDAAQGRTVVEFGARRAHGLEAATLGARAAIIGGCAGTSNLLAGRAFDIPVYGTAAHSFTMSFAHEIDAFRAYHQTFPGHDTLLIDTYDTQEGARRAMQVGKIAGVRLDSGDLASLSIQVRRILDEAGQTEARIVASGDLNEERIAALIEAGARIDIFGVGTELITSRDAPALGGVYKLVAIDDGQGERPVSKRSQDKASLPGVKQVLRTRASDGRLSGDVLALATEPATGEALLEPVIRAGTRAAPIAPLLELQARARAGREALPASVRRLRDPDPYPVTLSTGLAALAATLAQAAGG
jgi:nicotinate phosphoribosyltransferase